MSDKTGELRKPRQPQAVRAESQNVGRRTALKRLGLGLLGAGSVAFGWWAGSKPKPPEVQPPAQPPAEPPKPEQDTRPTAIEQLRSLAVLDINDPDRKIKEAEYAANAKTLEDIDKGFWAIVDVNARNELLNKRTLLRQKGEAGLAPLNSARIEWSKKEGVHPEALAICEDAHSKAVRILSVLQQKGEISDKPPLASRLISPGGLARITKFETSCFVFIGDTYSSAVFKDPDKESESERLALQVIADDLTRITGIDFDPNKIPSSYSGDIGFQFRPTSALDVKKGMSKAGEMLNVFDLMSSTTGAYILLAQKGFIAGDNLQIQKAVSSWNKKPEFAQEVIKANNSYNKEFRK